LTSRPVGVGKRPGGRIGEPSVNRWKLLIVGAAAMAALAVSLGAQAAPSPDDLSGLMRFLNSSFG